ncbi:AAA family ATPase [Rhodococcoides fascians]|uniref:AAA family ATPase n=1 Tax=Rhodococcoides fascians TaxID=1828 RepID=UPI0009B88FDF|nr:MULTISPECIES: AAA family ATPase [Rhodococcus]OZF00554.1 hypothetical protein CH301_12800 [Rhodococcus sp. 15-1189-1-1a]OZF14433.1 hypothetical protein CH299_13480 [Rhodococcus sp. 14-2686-1-2]
MSDWLDHINNPDTSGLAELARQADLDAALNPVLSNIRSVSLSPFCNEQDDVPVWAWEYGGKGRIPVGALALFAGRPGAGKSTSGRWIAACASNGVLPGCWYGTPVNVAYIAAEESAKYVVKPGLRAAGADLSKVFMPRVQFAGEEVRLMSSHDMADLTEQLIAHKVKLIVVDPLMSTIGSKTDINRNNEIRSLIEPWSKLAENVDGVVLGIAHLNKSGNGDVVAGINGSSAFGEVARAVFGFAKDPDSEDGDRIMSQEKNSIGEEDLALVYRIESTTVTTDSGKSADVGRFTIIGESERTVGDVLRDGARSGQSEVASANTEIDAWLSALLAGGAVLATEVFRAADQAGFSKDKAKRAKSRLNVRAFRREIPGPWWWEKQGSAEHESATPENSAPLLPSAPLLVSGLPKGVEEPQGSKGAREQRLRESDAPLPSPRVPNPADLANRRQEPRRRTRTRGKNRADRRAS